MFQTEDWQTFDSRPSPPPTVFWMAHKLSIILYCIVLRRGFSMRHWLLWNLLCRSRWPQNLRSTCLSLLSAVIKGVCNHCSARLGYF